MILIETVLGHRHDPAMADRLHRLEHADAVDTLTLEATDIARRRLRATSERGREVAIALPRDQTLRDGAVLLIDDHEALVVRAAAARWLALSPRDAAAALELGYHAGNLHWRVKFAGARLLVALEGPVSAYRARLAPLLASGAVAIDEETQP